MKDMRFFCMECGERLVGHHGNTRLTGPVAEIKCEHCGAEYLKNISALVRLMPLRTVLHREEKFSQGVYTSIRMGNIHKCVQAIKTSTGLYVATLMTDYAGCS
jgi:DNA-directed RNA polymerase subunit RPC12/RpoP